MVRKELTSRAFGWIAYTLSRSTRVDRPGRELRLMDYDQTHNLTAVWDCTTKPESSSVSGQAGSKKLVGTK